MQERERKLEAEYSSKIITLSEEVLTAKRDFENRMKSFQQLQVIGLNGMERIENRQCVDRSFVSM